MQVRTFVWAAGLAATTGGSALADQVHGNLASFNATQPNAVLNTFGDVSDGVASMVSFTDPMGRFSYDIRASVGNLFNDSGTISTQNALASLVIDFTGDVRAFGGEWWGTNAGFADITALITITLDNGDSRSFITDGPRFGGYSSDTTISSITIDAFGIPPAFPTMDNFRVAVVPLPPAAWAGLGMLGLMGGVRAVRRRG